MDPWLTTTLSSVAAGALGFVAYRFGRKADLRLADERLLLTIESGRQVAWDWDLATGRDLWLGDLKTMFGIDARRFSGRVEDFHRRVHPDDRASVASAVAESRANHTPYHATFRVLRPDGVTRWVNANGAFCYDGMGRATRMIGVATDITAQTAAEAALREREQHFREIADAAPAMLWLSGVDARCTYFNRSWLQFTGRRHEQEVGSGWVESVHSQDLAATFDGYMTAFSRREPFILEYRLRRCDGAYRWVFDVGVPRFSADGSFAGYIGSAIDITELKAARRALSNLTQRLMEAQESERRRVALELDDGVGQRVALLTIELDDLVRSLPRVTSDVKVRVDDVRNRAGDLVSHLQVLARRLHSSKLELLGIVATASSYCRDVSEQQHVTVDFVAEDIPDTLSPGGSLALFRVLQEAVTNAIQHSGARRVEVTLRSTGEEVELEVVDQGFGFDPRTVSSGPGSGLLGMHERLSVVGGTLSVESRPGAGAMVRARVPSAVQVPRPHHGELTEGPLEADRRA